MCGQIANISARIWEKRKVHILTGLNLRVLFSSMSMLIEVTKGSKVKARRESNPGRMGGKRKRYLCDMPSP